MPTYFLATPLEKRKNKSVAMTVFLNLVKLMLPIFGDRMFNNFWPSIRRFLMASRRRSEKRRRRTRDWKKKP